MRIQAGIVIVLINCIVCQNIEFQMLSTENTQNFAPVNFSIAAENSIVQEAEEMSGYVYVDPICLDDSLWKQQVTKIVGGSMGDVSRWPYLVSLQTKNSFQEYRHFCAAVMVAQNILLTTAHCIRGYRESDNSMSGSLNKDIYAALMPQCRHQQGVGRRKIDYYIIHPQYSLQHINYDVALLWLGPPPSNNLHKWDTFANYRSTVELIEEVIQSNGLVSTVGWGGTGYHDSIPLLFDRRMVPLQYASMALIQKSICEMDISAAGIGGGSVGIVDNTMICAKSFTGEDTCDGDSGGPLVIPDVMGDPKMDVVLGLTSWGPDTVCGGDLILPGVYTKLSSFVDWIDANIVELTDMMTKNTLLHPSDSYSTQFESSLAPISIPVINISLYTKFELPSPSSSPSLPFTEISQPTSQQSMQKYEVKSDQVMQQQLPLSATDQLAVYIQQPQASPPSLLCQVKNILQNATSRNCD